MGKPKATPKDFFLWVGAMITFYWSVIAFIFLMFEYINYTFPNVLAYYPVNPYQSGISYEMASIIVLLPLFMFLAHLIHRDISKDPSRKGIWVRRWALIFTLFLTGVAMVEDLISLLTAFLNGGELTTAFLLKTALVFLVTAGVFMHFSMDLKGYWEQFPGRKQAVAVGVGVLALLTILAGFLIVGTPAQARSARFDAQRVTDLQTIQSRVADYWQAKQKLPVTLDALESTFPYGSLPVDPQTEKSYTYQILGQFSFKLCATFSTANQVNYAPIQTGVRGTQNNWQHGSGQVCFNRIIDPSFYPPLGRPL
ncbi:hypothetical protein HKL94_02560 [Candidatus Parcubacteria bacterium]|nr:hypothetical protein [Candidatus Parcubacteria bacterium]